MFEMMAMLFYKNRITARKVWGFMEIPFNPPISFSIFAFRAEFRRKKVRYWTRKKLRKLHELQKLQNI